ncbi:DUF1211 domain-containing protein [Lactobacillus sp. CC-MHH1034]|nr:TMEM175 family protein [Agrilactobacillus fermenti]MCD2256492.1 DUF1211 domain-containing protein [Agrilactobacillus fermenti]
MEKLKLRLDAFSDAIIAIIITIMVLELPAVLHDSWPAYINLAKETGIFMISFFTLPTCGISMPRSLMKLRI